MTDGIGQRLTGGEERIALLAARGLHNDEIARELELSPKTVEWNLTRIYRKLGVRSRTELAIQLNASLKPKEHETERHQWASRSTNADGVSGSAFAKTGDETGESPRRDPERPVEVFDA